MTYTSEPRVVANSYVDREGIRLVPYEGPRKFVEGCVLTGREPQVCIHGLTAVCEIVDLVRG